MDLSKKEKKANYKELFALANKLICEDCQNEFGELQFSERFQKYKPLLAELQDIVESLEFFGGYELFRKFADLGMSFSIPQREMAAIGDQRDLKEEQIKLFSELKKVG